MTKLLDSMYIGAKMRFENFLEELRSDEAGVSSIVATVLLILIVILLVGIFWDKLQTYFSSLWDKVTGADVPTAPSMLL